jgi:hypothetical protein
MAAGEAGQFTLDAGSKRVQPRQDNRPGQRVPHALEPRPAAQNQNLKVSGVPFEERQALWNRFGITQALFHCVREVRNFSHANPRVAQALAKEVDLLGATCVAQLGTLVAA